MTLFIKNATDKYDQSADFIYRDTLEKTVTEHSLHKHNGPLIWSTGSDIQCNAPIVHETYLTVVKIRALEISLYIARLFMSPINVSIYGYSVNLSTFYYNFSGITTNTGLPFFLLPSPVRIQVGIIKFDIMGVDKAVEKRINENDADLSMIGGIIVSDHKRKKKK
jgi:hypothetical protein